MRHAAGFISIGGGRAGVPWSTPEHYLRTVARQVDADLEIDGSEGSKFRQIKALARSFQQLSSATATTYP